MATDGAATAAGAAGAQGPAAAGTAGTAGVAGDALTAGRAAEPGLLRITDARMLRALAHPARIAILEHLALDGPATATQCAGVAGLSPSACSYHLRALARFGFIEPAPDGAADGRHRPWQTRVLGIDYGDPGSSGAMLAAEHTLTQIVQQRLDEVKDRYRAREAEYPPDWREAAGLRSDVLHVSPAELAEVRDRLAAELSRFRRLDPVDRPPGALRVQVVLDLVPWFGPEDAK
jgi:DNA-binding transcriptional ArsR family regulator